LSRHRTLVHPLRGKRRKCLETQRFVSRWWCALSPTRLWTLDGFEPSRSKDRLGLKTPRVVCHPKTVSEHHRAAVVRAAGHPTQEKAKIQVAEPDSRLHRSHRPPFSQRTHLSNRSPSYVTSSEHASHSQVPTRTSAHQATACSRCVLVHRQTVLTYSYRFGIRAEPNLLCDTFTS
jgi:hypothetical protein